MNLLHFTLGSRCLSAGLLVMGLMPACIIATDDDDGVASSDGETGGPGSGSPSSGSLTTGGTPSTATGSAGTDDTGGSDSGGLPPGCNADDNLLLDPGFEAGSPNPQWDETSALFGSPICDASCTEDPGAAPRSGSWWVWFGGLAEPETASVSQVVTIDAEGAVLTFNLDINAGAGTGDDVFAVEVDDTTVFMVTDGEMAEYDGYRAVEVDISDFADGAAHTVTFTAAITGTGVTNFFVDDVGVFACGVPGGTTTTGTTGTDTGTTGTDTDATGTDTGTTGVDESTGTDTGTTTGSTGV